MLPVRTSAQLEVLLLVISYSKEAKLVAMLSSFFAGVDDWIKVSLPLMFCCGVAPSSLLAAVLKAYFVVRGCVAVAPAGALLTSPAYTRFP